MKGITIKIYPIASLSIMECAARAIKVAKILGIYVEFEFNGVECVVDGDSTTDALHSNYHDELLFGNVAKGWYETTGVGHFKSEDANIQNLPRKKPKAFEKRHTDLMDVMANLVSNAAMFDNAKINHTALRDQFMRKEAELMFQNLTFINIGKAFVEVKTNDKMFSRVCDVYIQEAKAAAIYFNRVVVLTLGHAIFKYYPPKKP